MPVERMYTTYYGIYYIHYDVTWAGYTYNTVLVKDFPNAYLVTEDYSCDGTKEATFIYPISYLNLYYIDGLAVGHISIYNSSTVTEYEIDSYTVQLKKTADVSNASETLGTFTQSVVTQHSIPTEEYITFPIFMNLKHQIVEQDERLLLYVSYSCGSDTFNDTGIAHYNGLDPSNNQADLEIKIPYAPRGG